MVKLQFDHVIIYSLLSKNTEGVNTLYHAQSTIVCANFEEANAVVDTIFYPTNYSILNHAFRN